MESSMGLDVPILRVSRVSGVCPSSPRNELYEKVRAPDDLRTSFAVILFSRDADRDLVTRNGGFGRNQDA